MTILRELGLPGGGEARVDDAVHVLYLEIWAFLGLVM